MTMQSLSTTTTELKPVELQSYLDEGWRIFVDTCSFMSSGCEPFFTRSAAAFRDAGVSIHCPKEVRRELEKNLSSPKEQTRQLAMRGLAAYDALDKLDVLREIDCPGSQENVFADPVFAKIFDEQRAEHKLLLITQDRRLAAGLYSRNQDEFMHFHPVHVLRLLSRGDLGFLNHPQTQELMFPPNMNDFSRQSVPMIRAHLVSSEAVPPAGRSVPRTVSAGRTGDVREASRPEKESVSKVVSKPAVPAVEKAAPALHAAFPVCTSVIDLEDRPVGIDRAPVEGDVVCDEFGMPHTLGRRLGEGGEGIVYDAGNGMVAKIYHADKCTTRREAKVRLLASRPIRLKGVCAPQGPHLEPSARRPEVGVRKNLRQQREPPCRGRPPWRCGMDPPPQRLSRASSRRHASRGRPACQRDLSEDGQEDPASRTPRLRRLRQAARRDRRQERRLQRLHFDRRARARQNDGPRRRHSRTFRSEE